jgi:hypothetical protein
MRSKSAPRCERGSRRSTASAKSHSARHRCRCNRDFSYPNSIINCRLSMAIGLSRHAGRFHARHRHQTTDRKPGQEKRQQSGREGMWRGTRSRRCWRTHGSGGRFAPPSTIGSVRRTGTGSKTRSKGCGPSRPCQSGHRMARWVGHQVSGSERSTGSRWSFN